MASCSICGSTILFGGIRAGDLRFCNQKCQAKGGMLTAAARIPDGDVQNFALHVHAGLCPQCHGPGPVDVHTSYRVWSALVLTQWQSLPLVGCRRCGVRGQIQGLFFSLFLGWWGFPWGLLFTPVQIGRNLLALLRPPSPAQPSEHLLRVSRIQLASRTLE